MSQALFQYPQKAYYGRLIPKTKIYEHAKITNGLRQKFISQVDKIIWEFKLSPETINLPSMTNVPEIEIFSIKLKKPEVDREIIRCIDQAIPFPAFYQLIYENRIKIMGAYKCPQDIDSNKWVVDSYFESPWEQIGIELMVLPFAMDLAGLYEEIMRHLLPFPARSGESLQAQIERIKLITRTEKACHKLEVQLKKEKQFNRKVELNSKLHKLKKELEILFS